MGFAKLESAITGQIASLFQKRGAVEPSALLKALEREVIKQETKTNEGLVVPNDYTIYLCEEDCHKLSAARIIKALHETVARKVIREDCIIDGNLSVRIEKMLEGNDAIVIKSKYVDDSIADEDTIDLDNDVLSNTLVQNGDTNEIEKTLVADKNTFSASKITLNNQVEYEIAKITLNNGDDKVEFILGERQFFIGRKETNDLILNDESVSRIHAYISYERHRHILHDTNSLNGTYINKKLIVQQELQHGDKINFGSIEVIYEAL